MNCINRLNGEGVEVAGTTADGCASFFFAFEDKLRKRDDACLNDIDVRLYSYQSSDMNV
jgi:hypothetical protein